jgi:hypothetical protein
LRPSAE